MVKILHTSDLHFKKDDLIYCQDIWREILAIGNSKKVDAVLISGDVFDSFPELESCRESFLEIAMQSKLSIYAIAGNHEYLSMGKQSLDTYDLTKIVWLYKPGYQKIEIKSKDWELFVLPYNEDYADYRNWKIPIKEKPRVLMAHGLVPEAVSYTGPDSEDGSHILELDMLARFQSDYIALGHIHRRMDIPIQNLPIFYPGSPRVWRKGEIGVRSVNLLEFNDSGKMHLEPITIQSAGEYREFIINVQPDGNLPNFNPMDEGAGKQDFIFIIIKGVADNETLLKNQIENRLSEWSKKYRKVEIDVTSVKFLEGISNEIIVKKFLAKWYEKFSNVTTSNQKNILLKARQIGLEEIVGKLKA
jgi:DNA repair exonuclease SbcCD nuclease subunit